MKRTPKNIVYHELIGLNILVLSHSDKSLVGRKGMIVDETMNTLKIVNGDGKEITVPKLYGMFRVLLPNNIHVDIDGSMIIGRPEDRLKKIKKT